jgi:hypothetical protein
MNQILPEINLSLEKQQDNLIAHLVFLNNTENDLYLDRQTICFDSELQRNLFSIVNGNKKLDYIGMMVKRDVEPEDFIILNSGQKKETSVVLNEGYKLSIGKKYSIQYIAFNPPYLEVQELMKMQSNRVEISY